MTREQIYLRALELGISAAEIRRLLSSECSNNFMVHGFVIARLGLAWLEAKDLQFVLTLGTPISMFSPHPPPHPPDPPRPPSVPNLAKKISFIRTLFRRDHLAICSITVGVCFFRWFEEDF